MRILLLCSAFNGLSQRAWLERRATGHDVVVQLAGDDDTVRLVVAAVDPDLVICPFLRTRIPAEVCDSYPTVVIHPGPKGDRGSSGLDWAIMESDRDGDFGVLAFRIYNGAMSTQQCRRLHAALRHAVAQDTQVLLLRGRPGVLQRYPPQMSNDIFGDRRGFAQARSSFITKGAATPSRPQRRGEPRPTHLVPAGGVGDAVATPVILR